MRRSWTAPVAAGLAAAALATAAQAAPKLSGTATGSVSANDNIMATPQAVSDAVYGLTVEGDLNAGGAARTLHAFASLALSRYADTPSENTDDWSVGANGAVTLRRGDVLNASAVLADTTEPRSAKNADRLSPGPNDYLVGTYAVGYTGAPGRLQLSASAQLVTLDYDDRHDARDRATWTQTVGLTYSPDARLQVYGQAVFTQADYDLEIPAARHDRDSGSYALTAGARYTPHPALTLEADAGYTASDYADATLPDVDDLVFDANLAWTVSPRTSLSLTASRSLQETVEPGASAYVSTSLGATLNHGVTEKLSASLQLGQSWDGFKGIDREDATTSATASLTYALSSRVSVTGSYAFTREDSEGGAAAPGFDQGVVSATLTATF